MKGKIIRSFLAVYLGLSMVYSSARAAYLTVTAAMEPPERAEEQIALAAPASFGIDTVPAEPERTEAVIPSPAIQPEDVPPRPEAAAEPTPEEKAVDRIIEASIEEPEATEEQALETPEDAPEDTAVLTEAPEADSDEEEAYIEAPPAQDVPTLEDYLSKLHCGRCGRNCYLSNPRCRTGRSKAESATVEYYAEYGTALDL